METKGSAIWGYLAAAAIGLIIGGAIVFAIAPGKDELRQALIERDTLRIEVRAFNERMVPLQHEVKTLQEQNAAGKTEIDRLTAALAEKEQAGAKASSELGDRGRAMAALEQRERSLAAENDA